MGNKLSNIGAINFLGYLFLVAGILGMAADFVARFQESLNIGTVLADGALAASGLIATMVARSLQELDQRLRQLENVARA